MNRRFLALLMASLFILSSCATVDRSTPVQVRGKIPQTPEYAIRNGEKVPFNEYKLEDGDIIQLGEGVYNLNSGYYHQTTIIGAGIDKTFVVVPGVDGWRVNTEKGVTVKNLSIVNPRVRVLGAKPGKATPRVVFLNVKTYGNITVENLSSHLGNRHSVSFFFSQLDNYLGEYNGTDATFRDDFTVAFSWLNNDTHDPISDGEALNVGALAKLKDTWVKEAQFGSPDSAHNIKLFNRLYSQFRANSNGTMSEIDAEDMLAAAFEIASNEIGNLNSGGAARSANTAEIEKSLVQAARFRGAGNLLLESLALNNAKQANLNRADEKLDALIATNNKKISAAYGCYIGYRRAEGNNNTSMQALEDDITASYRYQVGQISKLIAKLGSPDSPCSLNIIAERDSYAGVDTGEKVVSSEQLWKEDPEVKAMREMYREAANRAAQQAAQAQFTNSLDRLQSTAKQLSQNRNKIESRTGGLYLVTNNRSVKGNSAADTKGYQDQIDQANKAKAQANSINAGMIKDGTKTTTEYYKTEVNYIHYRLVLKAGTQQKDYDFPEELYQQSNGPCQRESYSNSNFKFSSGGWDTSCNVTSYHVDARLRAAYIAKYLAAPTDQFILDAIYPRIIKEVQRKRSKSDAESQLDGIILAGLFNDNAESSEEYEQLMQKVFGYTIAPAELQARILAI